MLRSIDAARAICECSGWTVSNLAIHKMLYIAHGSYMAKNGADRPLISGYFEAWDYGPVEPDLYRKFKLFGADSIEPYALTMKERTRHDKGRDENKHIRLIVDKLQDFSISMLISMTHVKSGAWYKSYDPDRSHVIIPNEAIYDEYKGY